MTISITREDPFHPVCLTLMGELSAELGALYGGDDGGAASADPSGFVAPGAAFVLAWSNGQPVGCGALRPFNSADTVEVKRMYVRPAARGNGISRLILRELERLAREFGYRRVILETGTLQPEAIRLYESEGYLPTDCYGEYADDPVSVCFDKRL
ncbi:MAG: GNAT family N-acetyltransferase [Chloroflexi bacterium]|nr:GNAT family N-acetyltransferase [Chloroflexota bacterium]